MEDERQAFIDQFYMSHGPCCAGCDWWRSLNSSVGLCSKAAPVSSRERSAMLGISGESINIGAGHPLTKREHHCGDFQDNFDWTTLPLAYLKRIDWRCLP